MRFLRKLAFGTIVVPFALLAACSADRSSDADRADLPQVSASADESAGEADRTVTELVRKRIVDQEGLSSDVQDVEITTRDGVVTLRGPVATAEEKAQIAALAAGASRVKRIDDQLEVESAR